MKNKAQNPDEYREVKTNIKKEKQEKERYDFKTQEQYWQDFWERKGVYNFNPNHPGEVYTVDTPPPTISGALHLGHLFSYTQAETIARYQRMSGKNIRYSFGFDNNGLPTERLVEKETQIRGNNTELSKFIETCLNVTEKYKLLYEKLWRSIGLSVDWRLGYSTISKEVQKLSQTTFKELFERGLIYRQNAPALYCTECRTSFAQAEKEDSEHEAVFYDLSFKTEDGKELIVATTRPELLPACSAVFVHPNDERFKHFVGKKIVTPLGQVVELMADEKVEKEKGSGAVMCCTYGDETDIYWAKKYQLKEKIVLDERGRFKDVQEIPELKGKTIKEARSFVVTWLGSNSSIKTEKKIKHNVDVHERCGTPVEFLPTTQWFVKTLEMKERLLEAGNKIQWHPTYMKKRFEEWVNGLKWDWCISRERFYGIPIPAFSCNQCEEIVIADESELPIDPREGKGIKKCPHCKKGDLIPEKNVLDTWFTSALSPDMNNDHPMNGHLNKKMYPMSMRPQAHDIIRTWAFYSILMGLYKHNEIPWEHLMISGHILIRKGEKISKKTGGGKYRPEELITTHSADAVRYAMSGVSLGKDSYFEEKEVEKGKKLVTKLYNACKLVISRLDGFDAKTVTEVNQLESIDKWILNKSFDVATKMSKYFENYEFGQARQTFEDFFWNDFCDNYLEIVKSRLSQPSNNTKEKLSAQYASYHCLLNILKMVSPFVPHITEEMYHAQIVKKQAGEEKDVFSSSENGGLFAKNEGTESIHSSRWPKTLTQYSTKENDENTNLVLTVVAKIRKYRADNNIKYTMRVSQLTIKCSSQQQNQLKETLSDIKEFAKANAVNVETIDSEEMTIEMQI